MFISPGHSQQARLPCRLRIALLFCVLTEQGEHVPIKCYTVTVTVTVALLSFYLMVLSQYRATCSLLPVLHLFSRQFENNSLNPHCCYHLHNLGLSSIHSSSKHVSCSDSLAGKPWLGCQSIAGHIGHMHIHTNKDTHTGL